MGEAPEVFVEPFVESDFCLLLPAMIDALSFLVDC